MVIVVDSSVWIDMFRDRATDATIRLRSLIQTDTPVYATDVVYGELLAGSLTPDQVQVVRMLRSHDRLLLLRGLPDFERAAACHRASRKTGHTVRSIADCLIASVCIREDARLLHDDRDFRTIASCTELRELVP